MKKVLCIMFMLFNLIYNASAQSIKDRSFHNFGFAIYTDYIRGPLTDYTYYEYNSVTSEYDIPAIGTIQHSGLSLFTFIYRYRYNLYESSDNMAVSLSAIPAVGVSIFGQEGAINSSEGGAMHFNFPLMVGLEMGAGSTYNSTANMGGHVSLGIEYTNAPMFGAEAFDNNSNPVELEKSWIQPVVSGGVRYWNKRNKLREINIKFGWASFDTDATIPAGSKIKESGMSIRLSWMRFINY